FWEHEPILKTLEQTELPGCFLRPLVFEPTSGKWAGKACVGFQLHVTDAHIFMPYRTSLALLQVVMQLYSRDFSYKEPPYEYEYERLPMDLILGDQKVRQELEDGLPISEIEAGWQERLQEFQSVRKKYFLYPEESLALQTEL
ncbi:MAG: DUF1343 domain-containing protein, partial [Proteobacteria bacterium]|nr:DUF1343 domain-containing protein [Pseudomonadota bacterium]